MGEDTFWQIWFIVWCASWVLGLGFMIAIEWPRKRKDD